MLNDIDIDVAEFRLLRHKSLAGIRAMTGGDLRDWCRLAETADRARAYRLLSANLAADGLVGVVEWGRDCDGVEATLLHRIPADVDAFEALCERIERDAEGPWRVRVITPEEAAAFVASWRDVYAELAGY